jgi:hypothetical protein
MLNMKEIIDEIVQRHRSSGIDVYGPATTAEIVSFEEKIGFPLYEIFNGRFPEIAMTSSLLEFLNRFLKGNIFGGGGLYEWHNELGIK